MSVTDASRRFSDLINRTYYRGESTVLVRSGEAVARVVPIGGASVLGMDWVEKWRRMPHLDVQDAENFAVELESARGEIRAVKSPWD